MTTAPALTEAINVKVRAWARTLKPADFNTLHKTNQIYNEFQRQQSDWLNREERRHISRLLDKPIIFNP